ncbi:MAG: transglutaminase domain-containing protein [Rubrivivax sp.]|nr:MAG: transglutaminase domain-containing protein [Rubrivivax sp.]
MANAGDANVPASVATTVSGSVYPAVAGLVFAELDADGKELQRSTTSASDGSFTLVAPLSGTRLQAIGSSAENRLAPVYSTRLRAESMQAGRLEITALTTWYDQQVENGVTGGEAAGRIASLVSSNCLPQADAAERQQAGFVHADLLVPDKNHDWLLDASSAYLQSMRDIGLDPALDIARWTQTLEKRADLLGRLCQYASTVSTAAWKGAQATRVRGEALYVDNARLDAAIAEARSQGLALLAKQMQVLEYPAQTAVLQPQFARLAGRELSLSSDFVAAQYQQSTGARTQGQIASPTATQLAVTSAGEIVGTVQGSAVPTSDAPARLRLWNHGNGDRMVRLALNGQYMADLGGVLEQIIAMPLAYTAEPLYRKAWRYVIAHRERTVPVAVGNFQYQPDLWLRSVGSSYCEAQATALHFIWKAMGYEARVMGLTGHVVPEIKIDGRWQIFDPYMAVYYMDRSGKSIVGVSELQQDPSLVSNPSSPLIPLWDTAYSTLMADIYGTPDDNFVMTVVMAPTVQPMGNELQIPAGGYATFEAASRLARASIEPGYQVNMAQMQLWIPPGYTGTIKLPLLLVDLKGVGKVRMLGQSLDPQETDVKALLDDFLLWRVPDVGVNELAVDSVGAGGLTLTLMLNPLYFGSGQPLTVRAFGPDVKGLSFNDDDAAKPPG